MFLIYFLVVLELIANKKMAGQRRIQKEKPRLCPVGETGEYKRFCSRWGEWSEIENSCQPFYCKRNGFPDTKAEIGLNIRDVLKIKLELVLDYFVMLYKNSLLKILIVSMLVCMEKIYFAFICLDSS